MGQNETATADTVEANRLERAIDATTAELIEQISAMYREYARKVSTRNDKRIRFNDQVRICPANAQGVPSGPSVMAPGRDLSLWGISLLSPKPFSVGTCLVIEFTLPSVHHVVMMLGQVRHVRREDFGHVLGCEFVATLSD